MELQELAERLRRDPSAVRAVMESPDGRALLRALQGNDGGAKLERAAAQAAGGNTAQMTQMLKSILSAPGGAQLLGRIARQLQK
jgi:hypothetical protein